MKEPNLAAFPQDSNEGLKITVKNLRTVMKRESKTKAYCAVELSMAGGLGKLDIDGFSVVEGEKGPWVGFPQRRGECAWFPVVKASGKIQELVCAVILDVYAAASK